ncbi:hypothetical protein HK102_005855, partial [Quaeritorhiza haematococci]
MESEEGGGKEGGEVEEAEGEEEEYTVMFQISDLDEVGENGAGLGRRRKSTGRAGMRERTDDAERDGDVDGGSAKDKENEVSPRTQKAIDLAGQSLQSRKNRAPHNQEGEASSSGTKKCAALQELDLSAFPEYQNLFGSVYTIYDEVQYLGGCGSLLKKYQAAKVGDACAGANANAGASAPGSASASASGSTFGFGFGTGNYVQVGLVGKKNGGRCPATVEKLVSVMSKGRLGVKSASTTPLKLAEMVTAQQVHTPESKSGVEKEEEKEKDATPLPTAGGVSISNGGVLKCLSAPPKLLNFFVPDPSLALGRGQQLPNAPGANSNIISSSNTNGEKGDTSADMMISPSPVKKQQRFHPYCPLTSSPLKPRSPAPISTRYLVPGPIPI